MTASDEKRLYAELVALPGSERRVAELLEELGGQVRSEHGCVQFEPFVREDNRRHWVVVEGYADQAAFDAHLASEHSRAFNAEIAAHIVGGASTLVWLERYAP